MWLYTQMREGHIWTQLTGIIRTSHLLLEFSRAMKFVPKPPHNNVTITLASKAYEKEEMLFKFLGPKHF